MVSYHLVQRFELGFPPSARLLHCWPYEQRSLPRFFEPLSSLEFCRQVNPTRPGVIFLMKGVMCWFFSQWFGRNNSFTTINHPQLTIQTAGVSCQRWIFHDCGFIYRYTQMNRKRLEPVRGWATAATSMVATRVWSMWYYLSRQNGTAETLVE